MNEEHINIEKIINHWIESSNEDNRAMSALFDADNRKTDSNLKVVFEAQVYDNPSY